MASIVATTLLRAASHPLPITDALSGIFGSISMTAWICLLIPQLIANYKAQSADGLSMAFLIVWLLGDITNLIGALFTHLAPTAVALASYFCVADMVLISQCVYYNTRKARSAARGEGSQASEQSPLLGRRDSVSAGVPNGINSTPALAKPGEAEDGMSDSGSAVNNGMSLIAVYIIGFAGWFLSYKAGAWDVDEPIVPDPAEGEKNVMETVGLTLGYISAVCYLCARVPQILKNYREKSCEGLAILFFMLSLTGNLTYGVSLVAYSQDRSYLLNALPWLLGSVGTIVEDCIIFVQFRLYTNNTRSTTSSA